MILHRVLASALAAAACLVIAGCSTPITGQAGVRVVDGEVQTIVEMCPGVTANELHMGSRPFWEQLVDPLPSWTFEPTRSTVVNMGSLDEILGVLGEDTLLVAVSASEGVGGVVRFTAEDLQALEPGEILIAPRSGKAPVDQARFDYVVEQLCN